MDITARTIAERLFIVVAMVIAGCESRGEPKQEYGGSASFTFKTTRIDWLQRESRRRSGFLTKRFNVERDPSDSNTLVIVGYQDGEPEETFNFRMQWIRRTIEEIASEHGWNDWLTIREERHQWLPD